LESNSASLIRSRHEQAREIIANAARSAGRAPDSVRLLVVTKTHPLGTIHAALEAGVRDFGENYVEEAVEKIKSIGLVQGLNWHMIGHVQSRKADMVAQHFSFVDSLDSMKLANRLSQHYVSEAGQKMQVLLECNVSGETTKFGYPAFTQANWEQLAIEAEQISKLSNLEICGLMTMPPFYLDADKTRPFFIRLRELSEFLAKRVPQVHWTELSMGTSTDYSVAVEEGATIVRLGTAILGERPPRN
jgi:pyridoxal phosphate enzyme (YggS family)